MSSKSLHTPPPTSTHTHTALTHPHQLHSLQPYHSSPNSPFLPTPPLRPRPLTRCIRRAGDQRALRRFTPRAVVLQRRRAVFRRLLGPGSHRRAAVVSGAGVQRGGEGEPGGVFGGERGVWDGGCCCVGAFRQSRCRECNANVMFVVLGLVFVALGRVCMGVTCLEGGLWR